MKIAKLGQISRLQKAVGEWSRQNFGDQVSKWTGQKLGSLNPLMGIGEEIGELFAANTDEEVIDAISDIGIYLLDYATRENIDLENILNPEPIQQTGLGSLLNISSSYGKLLYCTLKRHQGIRGFDNKDKYVDVRNKAINSLILNIVKLCSEYSNEQSNLPVFDKKLFDYVEDTWNKIVSKRNWVAKPEGDLLSNPLSAIRDANWDVMDRMQKILTTNENES